MDIDDKFHQINKLIESHRNGDASAAMARMGLVYGANYGVSIPELKQIAQKFAGDHELALKLFSEDVRECKILASLIDNPVQVTDEQMDSWSQSFINHEIVEQVCGNLFWKSEYALSRSLEWCLSNDEMLQKAGMIIAARRAADPSVKDDVFEPYIEMVLNFDEDQMSIARNSAAFTLRQIALRNETFRSRVVTLAQSMAQSEDENRAWVGGQLLFELEEVEE